jgi:predicted neutral ceramidase superfamily lipid hydrolase
MLVKKKQSAKKTFLLLFVTFLLFGVSGYILYTNLYVPVDTSLPVPSSENVNQQVISSGAVDTAFEEDLFDSNAFKELKTHEDIPVKVRSIGKDDLFGLE